MNGSWSSVLNKLTIPQGAGPADPRFVVGPDIPPELIAWTPYNPAHVIDWIAVELFYFDATNYAFTALVRDTHGVNVDMWVYRGFYTLGQVCIYERFGPNGLGVNYYDAQVNQSHPYMLVDGHDNGVAGDWTMPGSFNIGDWVDFTIRGVSQSRGVYDVFNSVTSPTLLNVITGAEASILTLPGPHAQRCYSYEINGMYTSATSWMLLRLRDWPSGFGTDLGEFGRFPVSASLGMNICSRLYLRNTGAGTRWYDALHLNAQVTGAGTAQLFGTAATPVKVIVRDEGAASDFPGVYDWMAP